MECQSIVGVSTLGTKRFASVKGRVAMSEMTHHEAGYDATTHDGSIRGLSYSKSHRKGGGSHPQLHKKRKRVAPTIAQSIRDKE